VLNSASNAPICNLPEVRSVFVREYPDKSTIRWASVIGAAGYDIMKKTVSGDFVLVERVTDPVYTIYLAAGNITYDHFKIAAVCPESGTSSPRASVVTRVRTGPELIILGIFASLLGGWVLFMRRKKYFY
jgi:LPXTG-motif cell wall-anchored protein